MWCNPALSPCSIRDAAETDNAEQARQNERAERALKSSSGQMFGGKKRSVLFRNRKMRLTIQNMKYD